MSEKNESDEEKRKDREPGFQFNLPMGSWIRGGSEHLAQLMPLMKWIVFCWAFGWIVLQVVRELRL